MRPNLISDLIKILYQDTIDGGEGSDVIYGQMMDDQLIHSSSAGAADVFYGAKDACLFFCHLEKSK